MEFAKKHIVRRTSQPTSLTGQFDILSRIYAARGVASNAELDHSLSGLLPFSGLKGIEAAAEILADAIQQQKSILIVGDFDADGATSTAVGCKALQALGAKHIDFLVPNRFEYGYGLTTEIVELAMQQQPQVLVTVDNGISSIAGVAKAKAAGMQVVITDHHLAGDELPDADAIVNPNQPGCTFASKALAGVGVIFYVMLALRAELRTRGHFDENAPNLAEFLDIVALGTVADVVPLDRNNRILVDQGLRRIRAGKACGGIRALLQIARREEHRLTASDLGFAVGPRLNAAGRLDDMTLGIQCLLAQTLVEGLPIAAELDQLNEERKVIEREMKQQAVGILQHEQNLLKTSDEAAPKWGVCLYDPQWHQGVIGILAGRIKEQLHRPVIAFADENADSIKGSARSIAGVHIRDVLDVIAKRHPDLLNKFGGHAMAAGLSIARDDFSRFSQIFDATVGEALSHVEPDCEILSDGELAASELNLQLAETLKLAGPWGQTFPEPCFDGVFEVAQQRIVGERHIKLKLRKDDVLIDAIAFNAVDDGWASVPNKVRLAYKLDVNEYQGIRKPQLLVEYIDGE